MPVDKIKGDSVYTGTINCFGSIDIKVSKSFSDSSLNKMISLVKQAEDNKAPMQGNLAVSDLTHIKVSENELLKIVGSAEIRSEHPIGKAIVSFAKEKKIDLFDTEEFSMFVGKGVISKIQDKRVLFGNEKLMPEEEVNISEEVNSVISELRGHGKAIVITAIQGSVIGIIAFSDIIKENANSMIDKLLKSGISDTILLTGDNKKADEYIGNKVCIKEIKSSLLPEDKSSEIVNIQNIGQLICMVGDGVNDAPALKTTTVGVAMGTIGSDIAIEAADIAIMGDDISKIGYIKRLSNATLKTIKFNIIAAMVINIVAIILLVMGLLNPVTGALVHNVGSVLVVLNAALLYDRKYIQ